MELDGMAKDRGIKWKKKNIKPTFRSQEEEPVKDNKQSLPEK